MDNNIVEINIHTNIAMYIYLSNPNLWVIVFNKENAASIVHNNIIDNFS